MLMVKIFLSRFRRRPFHSLIATQRPSTRARLCKPQIEGSIFVWECYQSGWGGSSGKSESGTQDIHTYVLALLFFSGGQVEPWKGFDAKTSNMINWKEKNFSRDEKLSDVTITGRHIGLGGIWPEFNWDESWWFGAEEGRLRGQRRRDIERHKLN